MPPELYALKPDEPMAWPGQKQPEVDKATQRLYEDTLPSIVRIETGRGTGSGFAVGSPGLIATDWHCVRGVDEIFVRTADGQRFRARIKDIDDIRDLAVLELDGKPPASLKPLDLANPTSGLAKDTRVSAMGHPDGASNVYISPGKYIQSLTFAELRHATGEETTRPFPAPTSDAEKKDLNEALERTLIWGNVHARHGNSGGPLLNEAGKVVGITDIGADPIKYSQTMFTPASDLKALLDREKPKFNFKYEYVGEPWTQDYLGALRSSPLLTGATTLGAGYMGVKTLSGTGKFGTTAQGFVGAYGVMNLFDDVPNALHARDSRDLLRYSSASLFDGVMATGGAMSYFSKPIVSYSVGELGAVTASKALSRSGKIGVAVLAVGLAGRIASEFIANRLVQTDVSRTDGDTRPPLSLVYNPPVKPQ